MSLRQNAGQNHNIKTPNRLFENVAKFQCLDTTLTNQNLIYEEIKSKLISVNTCYHSVQNLLSFLPLPKNIKIKICKSNILPIVLYVCETWSLTLREEPP
jgi:hypothetical protein